ncbi:hypothetical protein SmJEL517_g05416 [Synchytrium microbalum]|uniref:Malectin domain-containing protein n=1 Tax=Synchytrium microbalum TaxID=1806994 RepID=A0A507BV98_9FUNG|nr:uncharacterized protein SmJEL517_g05416 [Synchytrium microbalum]TPX31168.1 hypothetical protein SmJEL517_g05416 [Synchytrium microbalum]
MKSILALAIGVALPILSQAACTADILMDDFRMPRPFTNSSGLNGGPTQQNLPAGVSFNLVDADYGEAGVPYVYNNGSMTLTVGSISPVYTPDPSTNPKTANTFNYWYTKFNNGACFDATSYTSVEIIGTFPVGVNFNITMTQKASNCLNRTIDSEYHLLTKYITPSGSQQTLTIPFSDFSQNLLGAAYDFVHLKDFTLVNITPQGAVITLKSIKVLGNCATGNATTPVQTLPYGATSTPRSGSSASPVIVNTNAVVSVMALCIGALVGVLVL